MPTGSAKPLKKPRPRAEWLAALAKAAMDADGTSIGTGCPYSARYASTTSESVR